MSKLIVTSIKIDSDLLKKIKHEAIERDLKLQEVVKQALEREYWLWKEKVK
jgi:predicted transcriptional regulator